MEPLEWEPRIYRVAARIKDLRDSGHRIETYQTCNLHRDPQHHAAYELADQAQMRLI